MRDNFQRSYDKLIGERGFSDPFVLPSNESFPDSFGSDTFDFCAYLYYLNPHYMRASERVISFFITNIEFVNRSGDSKEQDSLANFLEFQLRLYEFQKELGSDFSAYGNGFGWIYLPFNRYLVDHRELLKEYALGDFRKEDVEYNHLTMKYKVTDPKTFHLPERKQQKIEFSFRDKKTIDLPRVALRRLDPRHVRLQYSIASGEQQVIWMFDPELLADVRGNQLHQINTLPLPMLQAISTDSDFIFGKDQVFHLKAPTISGISNAGWGLPEVIANYRMIHLLQVYRKIDEAVGMDYVLPFRIITPNMSGDKVGDSASLGLMSQWRQQMGQMIRNRRQDPFAIHALPLPVNMQQFGGDASKLVNPEMTKYQTDTMLDSMGFPAELIHGTMAVQQIPTTLRLFENQFAHIYGGFNRFTQWVVRRINEWRNSETQECRQMRPSLADDLEKRGIYLQLVAGGEVPRRMGYSTLGIPDPVDAAKQRAQEDAEIAQVQQTIQQDYQRKQQLGSMTDQLSQAESSGGGAAGGAPSGAQMTPLDRNDQIMQEVQTLLAMPDQGSRNKAWAALKASDQDLYAQVKQKYEDTKNQGASQGKQQVHQEAQQQQSTGQGGPQQPQ